MTGGETHLIPRYVTGWLGQRPRVDVSQRLLAQFPQRRSFSLDRHEQLLHRRFCLHRDGRTPSPSLHLCRRPCGGHLSGMDLLHSGQVSRMGLLYSGQLSHVGSLDHRQLVRILCLRSQSDGTHGGFSAPPRESLQWRHCNSRDCRERRGLVFKLIMCYLPCCCSRALCTRCRCSCCPSC